MILAKSIGLVFSSSLALMLTMFRKSLALASRINKLMSPYFYNLRILLQHSVIGKNRSSPLWVGSGSLPEWFSRSSFGQKRSTRHRALPLNCCSYSTASKLPRDSRINPVSLKTQLSKPLKSTALPVPPAPVFVPLKVQWYWTL